MKKLYLLFILVVISQSIAITSTSKSFEIISKVNPSIIFPGNEGYIEFTLLNTGTESINNIEIKSWKVDPAISIKTPIMKDLGSLEAGRSKSFLVKFSVSPTASSGFYTSSFTIDACYENLCKSYVVHVLITVQSPSTIEILSVEPNSIKIGEEATFNISIINVADSSLNNLLVSWQSLNNLIVPIGSDNNVFIQKIEPYETKKLSWKIMAHSTAAPGIVPITIKITYVDQIGNQKEIVSNSGIIIEGSTDFDINIESITENSVTLTLSNIGPNHAYSVILTIDNITKVIGNINSGDYTAIDLKPREIGKSALIKISYTDALGVRRTIEKPITLKLPIEKTIIEKYPSQKFRERGINVTMNYILIGILGVIALVLIFKFVVFRKKSSR
ncbi:MAG: hypothetical protein QXG91_00565 [Candidatus Aenigmatarchaeota archaeon]